MKNKTKCKKCGKEINLVIFGMPEDLCWGCASKKEQIEVIEKNIGAKHIERKK